MTNRSSNPSALALLAMLLGELLAVFAAGQSLTMSAYLSKVDKNRLAGVFKAAWPLSDVSSAHYAALGLSTLGVELPDSAAVCDAAKRAVAAAASTLDIETAYHASQAASLVKGCSLGGALKGFESKLGDSGLSAESLLQLVAVLQNEKLPLDAKKAKEVVDKLLKDDSSAGTVANLLLAAVKLGVEKAELAKMKSDMKDALLQADEADGQYLYYEKGVYTTALVAEALVKATDKLAEPVVPGEKLTKLASYLLSRRQIYQLKSAAQLLTALKAFSDSAVQSPVVVFLKGPATLSKSAQAGAAAISVQLADVWGRPVTAGAAVKLVSAKNIDSGAVFLKDAAMTQSSEDKSVYSVDFLKASPTVGFYQLTVSASSEAEKRFLFPQTVSLEVKVVSAVSVQSLEIAVSDRDQQSQSAPVKLTFPEKAKAQLEADAHQKLSAKFQVTLSGDSSPMTVHQAFIRLNHQTENKEAIFVAEPDKDRVYKFSVDLANGGKNFDHLSGVYSMELIIGDALIDKSLVWHLADIKLDIPDESAASRQATPQEVERAALKPKPTIEHVFRQPDKMAPSSVALAFAALCAAPLLVLLALWGYLGANVSGFGATPAALLFHAGLAGIVVLYFLYWRCLNMFETLRYLCLLGVPTFFFGNRLLRSLAGEKKSADA